MAHRETPGGPAHKEVMSQTTKEGSPAAIGKQLNQKPQPEN